MTLDETEMLEANAFVHPHYMPKDVETRTAIDLLADGLGLGEREKYVCALSSFVVACKTANGKDSNLIAFPGNANYYAGTGFGFKVATKTRDALIESGYLKQIQKSQKGYSAVYEFSKMDLSGQYVSQITWPIRVREGKKQGQKRGFLLQRDHCRKRFKGRYMEAESRVKKLNKTYSDHPLSSPDGLSWGGAHRVFNDGRLDRGGRLYGDWQQLKESDRLKLTIDGEQVAEIDITACFLFIASALAGCPITRRDPYSAIPWVKGKATRDLSKRLIASIISTDGPLSKFPRGVRDEFSIPKKDSLSDYQDPILETFPVLRDLLTAGLEVMFRESETVFATIEALATDGVVAYPVHDCLLVQKAHWELAAAVLLGQLQSDYGSMPWLTVGFRDEQEKGIDPERFLGDT